MHSYNRVYVCDLWVVGAMCDRTKCIVGCVIYRVHMRDSTMCTGSVTEGGYMCDRTVYICTVVCVAQGDM